MDIRHVLSLVIVGLSLAYLVTPRTKISSDSPEGREQKTGATLFYPTKIGQPFNPGACLVQAYQTNPVKEVYLPNSLLFIADCPTTTVSSESLNQDKFESTTTATITLKTGAHW